ncbi:MAG: glycosyltransferase family 2 protein [Candidatus Gagatemarchaeaceae archaeon]
MDVVVVGDTRNRGQGRDYAELLSGFEGVRQVHLVYDRNVGAAVNRGLRRSKTPYVVIAGGDCWFDQGSFKKLLGHTDHRGYRFAHPRGLPLPTRGFLDTGIVFREFLLQNPMDTWPDYCEEVKFRQPEFQAGLVKPIDVTFEHRHDPSLPHMSSRTMWTRKLWSYAYKFHVAPPLGALRRGILGQRKAPEAPTGAHLGG